MKEDNVYCMSCGDEVLFGYNVFSKDGWLEHEISGLCEVCFDNLTYSLEDKLDQNCEWVKLTKDVDGVMLAGGYMRTLVDKSDKLEDIDLFFSNEEALQKVKDYLTGRGYGNVFTCPQGHLFTYRKEGGMKVQLIRKRLYHDLEDLISSFDLTACSAGFDGVKVYSHRRFVTDVSNKIIAFNTIEYPVATLGRILKYKDKGYTIKGWAKEEYVRTVNESQYDPENMALYID